MDDTDRTHDEMYEIAYGPAGDNRDLTADGGHPTPALLETRERLVNVESDLGNIDDTLGRIEDKVDTVDDHVEAVDEAALSEERFENYYADDIERNSKLRTIAQWVAAAALAVVGIVEVLAKVGVIL